MGLNRHVRIDQRPSTYSARSQNVDLIEGVVTIKRLRLIAYVADPLNTPVVRTDGGEQIRDSVPVIRTGPVLNRLGLRSSDPSLNIRWKWPLRSKPPDSS